MVNTPNAFGVPAPNSPEDAVRRACGPGDRAYASYTLFVESLVHVVIDSDVMPLGA